MSPQKKAQTLAQDLAAEWSGAHDSSPSRASVALIAVCMDRGYTAIEAAFTRIARAIDERLPVGEGWHAALIHQMTLPIAERRAAVIEESLARALEPLRRHRHWLRHAYASTFEWSRMRETVSTFAATIDQTCAALAAFATTLA